MQRWLLEFVSTTGKRPDPLTGWAGGGETAEQVQLSFPDANAAKAYAVRERLAATMVPATEKVLKLQAYADDFR